MVEGTSLLRKHTGLTLYRGFESLALRQTTEPATPLNNAQHGKLNLQLKLEDAQGFGRPGG